MAQTTEDGLPCPSELPSDASDEGLVLLCCPEMGDLARRMVASSQGSGLKLGSIRWQAFPDGFPNIHIEDALSLRGRRVVFLASLDSPEALFPQLSAIYTLPLQGPASFTLLLPYFAAGTTEKLHENGQIVTSSSLARLVGNIPLSHGGPTTCCIVDMHSLNERFFFSDNVAPAFISSVPLLLTRLEALHGGPLPGSIQHHTSAPDPELAPSPADPVPQTDVQGPRGERVMLCFPDDGSRKRFAKQLQPSGLPQLHCTKERQEESDASCRVRLISGSPSPTGAHVVIVDDLMRTGCTLLAARRMLFGLRASHVSAYVSHAAFSSTCDTPARLLQPDPCNSMSAPTSGYAYISNGGQCVWTGDGGVAAGPITLEERHKLRQQHGTASQGPEQQGPQAGFSHIWVTDSCPTGAAAAQDAGAPFEVISLAPLLADIAVSM